MASTIALNVNDMTKAKELAEQMFPEPQMENYDDILEYRNDRDWTFIARGAVVKGYNQAEQDTIERACQILYDWNKQMTEMFGVKAVLSCNQFTIDVDRFRKILELE